MNKIFIFLIILFAANTWLSAQILNGGFEQWTDGEPDNWFTNNDFTTTITASTEHHSGNYSLKGEAIITSALGVDIPIFPFLQSISGIVQRGRYNTLSGYYKFVPKNDSLYISIQMLKNNQIIGYGKLTLQNEQSGFVEFQVNINYYNSDIPDTAIVTFGLEDLPGTGGVYSGSYFLLDDLAFSTEATDVEQKNGVNPNIFHLAQNYPNPFNPTTRISYSLPKSSFVTLNVYNLLGQKVAVLVNMNKHAGNHIATFKAGSLPSGIYIYKITAGTYSDSRKMILVK